MTTGSIKPNPALRHATVATALFCGLAIAAAQAAAATSEISLTPLVTQNDVMGEPMKAPMPPDHAMPGAEMTDPMPESSMNPMAMSKRMGPMNKMKGKEGMHDMKAVASGSELPAFPGASHLYHVGATGFFLDHSGQTKLTTDQQAALNRIKEKAVMAQADSDLHIQAAEQELWLLTAMDSPSAAKIEVKIRAIEKERGDERIAFIRAVGEAAKILTPGQRAELLGIAPTAQSAMPSPPGKPAAMSGAPMKDP